MLRRGRRRPRVPGHVVGDLQGEWALIATFNAPLELTVGVPGAEHRYPLCENLALSVICRAQYLEAITQAAGYQYPRRYIRHSERQDRIQTADRAPARLRI